MINVLLEPSLTPDKILPLVSVHIPDEDTSIALAAIRYTQHSLLEQREAAAGIPTTYYYDSAKPQANPLSERERHCETIADGLLSDQGWFVSHTISDARRNLDPDAPDGDVQISHDKRMLGTVCLDAKNGRTGRI